MTLAEKDRGTRDVEQSFLGRASVSVSVSGCVSETRRFILSLLLGASCFSLVCMRVYVGELHDIPAVIGDIVLRRLS